VILDLKLVRCQINSCAPAHLKLAPSNSLAASLAVLPSMSLFLFAPFGLSACPSMLPAAGGFIHSPLPLAALPSMSLIPSAPFLIARPASLVTLKISVTPAVKFAAHGKRLMMSSTSISSRVNQNQARLSRLIVSQNSRCLMVAGRKGSRTRCLDSRSWSPASLPGVSLSSRKVRPNERNLCI
jgi:hypothetical protein